MANPDIKENIFLRASKFVGESRSELLKCAWPSKDELTKSTMMVLAFVLVVAIWIGGLDFVLGLITKHVVGW